MNHLGLVARCVGYLSCDRKLAEILKGLSRFVTSRDTVCTACILLQSIYLSIDPANYLYQRLMVVLGLVARYVGYPFI